MLTCFYSRYDWPFGYNGFDRLNEKKETMKLTYKQERELLEKYPVYTDNTPSGLEIERRTKNK